MTTKRKALIFAAHGGVCHLCGGKIGVGEAWDAEHVIPWEVSRDDSDANLRPAHKKCHAAKTANDRRDIAKAKHREAKHRGFKVRSQNPIPGSRNTKWKKKMDGTVVLRSVRP